MLLPALKDLCWGCTNHFPRPLLRFIYNNDLRFHLQSFSFRSLNRPKLDDHELDLVTAPALRTIAIHHGRYIWETNGRVRPKDFNDQAILRLVAGLSTNLEEVRVISRVKLSALKASLRPRTALAPWKGFVSDRLAPDTPSHQGRLSCLDLRCKLPLDERYLAAWYEHTDFTCLRTLRLPSTLEEPEMELLAQHANDFVLLKELSFGMRRSHANNALLLGSFLRRLTPLQKLEVHFRQPVTDVVQAMMARHGKTLTRLELPGFFASAHELQLMHQYCGKLEELSISIRRSGGDQREVAS